MSRVSIGVLFTFGFILLVSGVFAYFLRAETLPAGLVNPGGSQRENSILSEVFGADNADLRPSTYVGMGATGARIALRFSLAAFLAGLLAYRLRRGVKSSRRNPFVAQTQILMAVVSAAMMMVVGDSAARAFGIFAAASLVRFRTNIRDPKEITVLLICLGVGLASGIGRWDMAVILTGFVLVALVILETFEQSQVFLSMKLCVETRNVDNTNSVLLQEFERYSLSADLRELNRQDEDDPLGKIVYIVDLPVGVSTGKISEEILAADTENIDSVEWDQKVSTTYIYK